jgi:hypothetical protein
MHEKDKLCEAQYFLGHLKELLAPDGFRYELSAFLSAARSALQYALEEAKTKGQGQAWYDAQVGGHDLIRFFAQQRNINIHCQPVRPTTSFNIVITDTIRVSEAIHIRVTNAKGEVVRESTVSDPPSLGPPPLPPILTRSYRFTDWNGSEDVVALCEQYLAEIQSIIDRGVEEGYLTQ